MGQQSQIQRNQTKGYALQLSRSFMLSLINKKKKADHWNALLNLA